MVDRHEAAPQDYPLPVVGGQAVREVVVAYTADTGVEELLCVDMDPAFDFLRAHNSQVTREIEGMLRLSGYGTPACARSAKMSLGMTHALLHAQARIDRGLPAIDMQSNEYFLPIVTEDTVTAYLAGAEERARDRGMTTYQDFASQNKLIPQTLRLYLELMIGRGARADRPTQAAEIAAIALHGMLREQAEIDAMHDTWGDSPLG